MEEDQNKGVDFSNYFDSSKKNNSAGRLAKEKLKIKKNKTLKILVVCLLIMAALWIYYFVQGSVF